MKTFLGAACAICIIVGVHFYMSGDVPRATLFAVLATFIRADYDRI